MTEFILNDKTVATTCPDGITLLDFIRYHQNLTGTKIGCREGDCGACTILAGQIKNGSVSYTSATSCLMPLGNANGKHIVTIEGINAAEGLTPVQEAMADEGATQCGFCTPGFIVSLTGFCLGNNHKNIEASIDGNICRCTGYKSIQRAAEKVAALVAAKNEDQLAYLVREKFLPPYFLTIDQRLGQLKKITDNHQRTAGIFVGGGTDLYVQKHDQMNELAALYLSDKPKLGGIYQKDNRCVIGASSTVTDLKNSELMQTLFPGLDQYIRLVSSTPIRNMATIAGNFTNASPIGDLTIFFLALDAQLSLTNGKTTREIPLREFYKGYKMLNKSQGEIIEKISFKMPGQASFFHFEKVSKRTHLDIASVNSAIFLQMDGEKISTASLSAGGVGPIPLYLERTSKHLEGKLVNTELIKESITIMETEISPISDTRGSAGYKRLLLGQLVRAHFIKIFPELHIQKPLEQ